MKVSWLTPNARSEVTKTSRSRNAFMQFLNTYRQLRPREPCSPPPPAWVTACEAGRVWTRMPLNDKYFYIEAARSAGYTFRSRDRHLNSIMSHLRKSLEKDERCAQIDVKHLSAAVKQLQSWKRRILRSMCADESCSESDDDDDDKKQKGSSKRCYL